MSALDDAKADRGKALQAYEQVQYGVGSPVSNVIVQWDKEGKPIINPVGSGIDAWIKKLLSEAEIVIVELVLAIAGLVAAYFIIKWLLQSHGAKPPSDLGKYTTLPPEGRQEFTKTVTTIAAPAAPAAPAAVK